MATSIPAKRLFIRMSSLGDVVLSTAALAAVPEGEQVDWLVANEFAVLLEGHPKIRQLHRFDRRQQGTREWLALCRRLWREDYKEVVDLHNVLRTRLARLAFWIWGVAHAKRGPRWRVISKARPRAFGSYLGKRLWPRLAYPRPLYERMARLAGGVGDEKPHASHILKRGRAPELGLAMGEPYVCYMPSAQWVGKRWPVERFVELACSRPEPAVVLGTARDEASLALVDQLRGRGKRVVSGVGQWDLAQAAHALAGARWAVGNDTGLMHLAEAVGTPVAVVNGPLLPENGFGPWRAESRALGSSLGCRPCGKDGRFCIRPVRRHACLQDFSAAEALAQWEDLPRAKVRTLRLKLYSALMRWVFQSPASAHPESSLSRPPRAAGGQVAWFHAASAGELESLWPLAEEWVAGGGVVRLSVFSRSGLLPVTKLGARLAELNSEALLAPPGLSPREGAWRRALTETAPTVFVTAKYEAWPELWAELSVQAIPLVVVGARARRSLRVCRQILGLFGIELPAITWIGDQEAHLRALRREMSAGRTVLGVDPRWARVASRKARGSERARFLLEQCRALPHPWGILGSVWPSDLSQWMGPLMHTPGTLWCVPHEVSERSVEEVLRQIHKSGRAAVRSSRLREAADFRFVAESSSAPGVVIVVDEMGFLAELYAGADWVYVGGGFGHGIHSVIEPAFSGVPISAGPAKATHFPEVDLLRTTGQLTLIEGPADLERWLAGAAQVGARAEWKADSQSRAGSIEVVMRALTETAARVSRSAKPC